MMISPNSSLSRDDHAGGTRVDPAVLRFKLREATSEAHAALDVHFADLTGTSPGLYHAFVRMNHACHKALEKWLAPVLPQAAHALRPKLVDHLAADMAEMKLGPLGEPDIAIARRGVPEAAGVIYVLDGSRLGARAISRSLKAARPALGGETLSTRYVTAAAQPGPVFAALNHLAADLHVRDIERSIAAAIATFELFKTTSRAVANP